MKDYSKAEVLDLLDDAQHAGEATAQKREALAADWTAERSRIEELRHPKSDDE